MRKILGYRATLLGLAVALSMHVGERAGFWDLSDWLGRMHYQFERHAIDDLVLGMVFLFFGVLLDVNTRRLRWQAEAEKREARLETLRATVHTAQDIVNNSLTGLQLFRMKAKESGALDAPALELFDDLVERTADNLARLGNVREVREHRHGAGPTFIDYEGRA